MLSRNAQRRAQQAKGADDAKLEQLRSALAEVSSERDARRDYEYEARKHLYQATEPLLFVLSERSVDLLDRIKGLARTASKGDLEEGRGWLSGDSYYTLSTVHRLVSPVAIFNLLQDSLTLVDLDLDRETRRQFELLRLLAWAMTDHYSFARSDPPIAYNPDGNRKAHRDPVQGLPSGWVETAGESLIVNQTNGRQRVMRFGEFAEAYSNDDSPVHEHCSPVATLLYDFHPRTHPVLWRCLVTQAHICTALTTARRGPQFSGRGPEGSSRVDPWNAIPPDARAEFDWRAPGDQVDDDVVLVEPFAASRRYLEDRLQST